MHYRQQAQHALNLARAAATPEACNDLLIIAASWHAMASDLEKSQN